MEGLLSLWNSVPHISEYRCIGRLFRLFGCHTHPPFDLVVQVHRVEGCTRYNSDLFIRFEWGRFFNETKVRRARKAGGILEFEERMNLSIRQCDNFFTVSLIELTRFKEEEIIALADVDIETISNPGGKMDKREVILTNRTDGERQHRGEITLHLALLKLEFELPREANPLLREALVNAQQEATATGTTFNQDWSRMAERERLACFAKVIEGELYVIRSPSMSTPAGERCCFFKAVEVREGRWEWCYWNSQKACLAGEPPRGRFPVLAISLVLPDKQDRDVFFVKYHTKQGPRDLFLRRKDRDRDVWSDGMYQFIEMLRLYLVENPPDIAPSAPIGTFRGAGTSSDTLENASSRTGFTDATSRNERANLMLRLESVRGSEGSAGGQRRNTCTFNETRALLQAEGALLSERAGGSIVDEAEEVYSKGNSTDRGGSTFHRNGTTMATESDNGSPTVPMPSALAEAMNRQMTR